MSQRQQPHRQRGSFLSSAGWFGLICLSLSLLLVTQPLGADEKVPGAKVEGKADQAKEKPAAKQKPVEKPLEEKEDEKPAKEPAAPPKPPLSPVDQKFLEAHEHRQQGRLDEALEVYDELTKQKADADRIAIGRSHCLTARGELAQATEALEAAAKTAAKPSAKLIARLAEVLYQRGNYDDCEKRVEQALKINSDDPLARLVQADLFAATGRIKEADEGYHWFITWYNRAQPEDAESLLIVGRGSAQYARWRSVSDVFDFIVNTLCPDALKSDKYCWEASYLSGTLLLEKYNRGQAIPEFESALKINPRAADVHAALAQASQQEHDVDEAKEKAEQALKINPHQIEALHVLADLKLDDGLLTEANEFIQKALKSNPHDERTLARLAAFYILQDGPPSAADLDELLLHVDNIAAAKMKKPGRFGELAISVAKRNPHPGVFFTELGSLLESRRKFDLAEKFYKQGSLSLPQLAEAKNALGLLYMRVGKIEQARKLLDSAFESDPYHIRISNMRKVLKVLEGYGTIATDHFVIRVDSTADKILGKYMAEYLEEQYPILVKHFGYEPPTRTQFEIYNKAKGLSAHEWFSARMVGLPWIQTIGASTGMIVALASPTGSEKPFNWARVLKHEFVHIVTLQQTQFNIPHWYTEALAVLNEGYPRPEMWNRLLLERVPAGNVMNLDNINYGFIRPKGMDDWHMAYCQSLLYAQYMLKTYGPDSTARLLDAYRRNLSTEQALKELFKVDKATFEKGYRAYLDEITAGLRGEKPEKKMTPAELEKAYTANPNDLEVAGRYADLMFEVGRRRQARDIARKIQEKNPREPRAAVVLARLELRSEDDEAAVKILETALDREKPQAELLELLAKTKLKLEKFDEAATLYKLGQEKFPGRSEWLKGLATLLVKAGKNEELVPVLEKLSDIDPDDAAIRKKLLKMAFDAKKYPEAIRYGKLTLQVDVLDAETHKLLAQAYAATNQTVKAAEEWDVAGEIDPKDIASQIAAIRAYQSAGQKDQAKTRLDKLAKARPANEEVKKLQKELQGDKK